ncbi:hypothetical protein VMCG_04888 [Cytospora schulzeri]|uniref:Uncharacterized protein n=1 Tax=Cytospora schulzeri TaxID=448051 RepID=A0A423WNF2_9PEZI|nr:hypothetical protein VMCG_04888 [Valsa malicola]
MAEQGQDIQSELEVSPPWGAFPSEQYLIRNWDVSSALSTANQRRNLIRAFLQLDSIPQDWDATGRIYNATTTTITCIPTEHEVREILQPWRPLRWREAALHLWRDRDDEEVWLRTYYDQDSDERFRELREVDEDNDPAFEEDCRSWAVLDDEVLFKGDWFAAFDMLPELAGPTAGYDAYSHRRLGDPDELEGLRQKLHESVASALRLEGYGNNAAQLKIDDVEAGPAGMALQASVVASILFIADAEAFETQKLRLLYLDTQGNIVRETRVPCSETWEMRDGWNARKFQTSVFWKDSERSQWNVPNDPGSILGERFKFAGDIGRELYQVD